MLLMGKVNDQFVRKWLSSLRAQFAFYGLSVILELFARMFGREQKRGDLEKMAWRWLEYIAHRIFRIYRGCYDTAH